MDRRTFLLVAAAGAAGGCLATLDGAPGGDPVADRSLTILDPDDDRYERDALTEPPRVTFDAENRRVVVTGAFFVGSSSCNRAVLDHAAYDHDAATLDVALASGRQDDAGNACSADESADHYRLVVTFEDTLPRTVVVTESGDPSGQTTTARNPNGRTTKRGGRASDTGYRPANERSE